MSVVWHLVRKDLRRLRLPLALFSVLMLGKIIFYAWISGLFSLPDIEWLRRMQNGPEMLLRALVEPIITYVLVGWLVFEDSPVEQDAHWITRPISGGQLFAAKLLGSALMFVVWPTVLNVAWWWGCGVGGAEILRSVLECAGMNFALAALGLACAALTGGFPRYILWSLVGVVVFGMLQLVFTLVGGTGNNVERILISVAGGGAFGLAIAGHQFVTRRRRRSLTLVGPALLAVVVAGSAWRGNTQRVPGQPAAPEVAAAVKLQVTGAARYRSMSGRQHYAVLPVRVDGVPEKSALAGLRLRGDWSFDGVKAWTSQANMSRPSLWQEAIRRQLGVPPPAEPDGQFVVNLPFSLAMAQRALAEPAALRAEVDLELGRGAILAEMPVREGRAGAYSIAFVSNGPFADKPRPGGAPTPKNQVVSLLLTEVSARGLAENSSGRTIATHYALVNRRTGRFFQPDSTRGGPEGVTVLNQAKVICWRVTFLLGMEPVQLDDWSLAILRFDRRETVHLEFQSAPVPFAADSLPEVAPVVAPESKRLSEIFRAHAAGDRFMGSVLVARGDTVLLSESAGWAEFGQKAANTPDTRFRIGSLTKQFTAAAILLLAEDGKLRIDDPLAKFIPDVPDAWKPITLRQLLTHTSGIPNFTNLPEFAKWRLEPRTPAQTMAMIRDRPLDFAPGEKFNYSNSGYILLGWVVELASGRSYADFLRERIFLPLGMKDTGCDTTNPPRPQHAMGYVRGRNAPEPAHLTEMQGPGGAGVIYSTTGDLLRWTRGLFGGRLLSAASLEQMTTPEKSGYAFGLGVGTDDGRKVFSHSGAIDGFSSRLDYFPAEKLTVVVLSNLAGSPAQLSDQLGDVALGREVVLTAERKEIALPMATLQRYTGVYQLAPGVHSTVRLAGDHLTGQISGQRALPLFPESEKKFFLKDVDAQVEFVTDDQGRVTHQLIFQNGRTQHAPRTGDVVERKAIPVAPEILAAYAGRYELPQNVILTLTVENGRLMIDAPRQGKSALLAETETKFFSEAVDAQAEFFKDAQGAVTHLVVHVGGRETRAERKP